MSEIGAAALSHNHSATEITSGVLDNARTSGTSSNIASSLVLRDASGNFSAGTITATLSGHATSAGSAGNSDTIDTYHATTSSTVSTVVVRDASANISINEVYASGWLRNSGQTGWYNSTYNTGIYAIGTQHIYTYNSSILTVSSAEACTSTTSGGLRVVGGAGVGGNIYAGGDIVAFSSDARLKENITLIDNALEKVKSLNGVIYNFNSLANSLTGYDSSIKHSGLLAQEVEQVLPEAVCIAPFDASDDGIGSKSGEFYKTVKYDKLVPLLIEAIKEQQIKIDALTNKINSLI